MSDIGNALSNIQKIIKNITATLQKQNISSENKDLLTKILSSAQESYIQFTEIANKNYNNNSKLTNDYAIMSNTVNDANTIIQEISDNYEDAIQKINIEKSTKIKKIQFNSYSAQMNNYNVTIMKILVFSSVLLMIDIFLFTNNILPNSIYSFIAIIIVIVTSITLISMIYSEYQRSSYNFNVFNW
uniref:Uncharacterized protein n=1 Tax=viral metagenome TaxID=1070528 RepID=A0A6C0HR11_9ZZZZ